MVKFFQYKLLLVVQLKILHDTVLVQSRNWLNAVEKSWIHCKLSELGHIA